MGKNIILLLALIVGAMTACSGSNSLSNLAMGTVDFQGSSGNSNALTSSSFSHTFSNPFVQTPSVAFGIWDANFGASSATQFSQFSIQVSEKSPSSVKFVFSRKSSIWTSIRIGFWASTRPDLTIGTSSADFGSFSGSFTQYNVQTAPIMNYQGGITRAYINGFALNSNSSGINIQIDGRPLNSSNQITLNIGVGMQTNVKKIYFSYLAFNPFQAEYASFGGSFVKMGFSGTDHQNIRNLVHLPNYALQGLNKVNSPFRMDFSTSVDNDFIYTVNMNNAFDAVFSYIFIGPKTQGICLNCAEKYAYDLQCVASCPSGTYEESYNAGGLVCARCSSKLNLILNTITNRCVCASGYQLKNGTCQRVLVQNSFDTVNNGGSGSSSGIRTISSTNVNGGSTTTTPPVTQNTSPIPQTIPTPSVTQVTPPQTVSTVTSPVLQPVAIPSPTNTNSYQVNAPTQVPQPQTITRTVAQPVPTPVETSISSASDANNVKSCAQFPNTYWTGYRCACRVGYKQNIQNGQCERLGLVIQTSTIPLPNIPNPSDCGANANYNGYTCVCNTGYIRNQNNICVYEIKCPQNSYKLGDACICNTGYIREGDICKKAVQPQCGPNSYRNSLGVCVCNTGYIKNPSDICILDNRCSTNEIIDGNGKCICIAGFYRDSQGKCVRCEGGSVWTGTACVFPCGIQEVYNSALKKCECKAGYGKLNGICSVCQGDFFLSNGFCVICPINSVYNGKGGCNCTSGYSLFNGFCTPTCEGNKIFSNGKCICKQGLGYINANTCGICPQGQTPDPVTQICGGCPSKQVLSGGKCICAEGYGFLTENTCGDCGTDGRYLMNGYCVTCPIGFKWDGQKCACPAGYTQESGQCVQKCGPGQLVDASGYCYTCPVNQVVSEGKCVCRSGYTRNTSNGFCTIVCPANQYLINGRCANCVLNTVYNPTLKACVCPSGYFINVLGVCEIFTPTPVECKAGQYYSSSSGCLPCPAGCKTCDSALKCTSCVVASYVPNGNSCVSPCGNGKKESSEGCDDANNINGDGCSVTCIIEFGWKCNGTPSVCYPESNCGNRVLNTGEGCDDGNTFSSDGCSSQCQIQSGYICDPPTSARPSVCTKSTSSSGMKLDSPIIINNGGVYATILIDTAFTFASDSEMSNFMKYSYDSNAAPSSNFCIQRPYDLVRFDCAFLYPSGVPNFKFNIGLSYNRNGKTGQLPLAVDPTQGQIRTRSIY